MKKSEYQIQDINCPACGYEEAKVVTHLMDIPYYQDFVMININCPDCKYRISDFRNLEEKGHINFKYKVEDEKDTTTKVVRSTEGTVKIPELGISIEPTGDASTWIRNIEGILNDIKEKLILTQKQTDDKQIRKKTKQRINMLNKMLRNELPFVIEIDDPSGNSLILPARDKKLVKKVIENKK